MANIYDYIESGFKVFGLYGVDAKGVCGCGNPDCEAILKHPIISNWQHVPHWSEDQIDVFEQMGHFKTGFGVLCAGWLIIDVDARNGGVESFKRLCEDIPEAERAAFVVNTGSGNGSQHHYFRLTPPLALLQNHDKYIGIDFKTSGYIVGCESLHSSGAYYEKERGHPDDITDAPQALIDLLIKPEMHRVKWDGGELDVDAAHIAELASYVLNDNADYEKYIRMGMAIHHALSGDGFEIWDDWCAKSSKNVSAVNEKKWHSFGKSANPAGYGTLLHYAKEYGYCDPVSFVYESVEQVSKNLDVSGVDLKRPPGFVGDLCQWINNQCLYPRETLSVAAALSAVSGLAGMRHVDELDDMTANLIAFCVAGSGTGKEAVQQAYLQIMRTAGVQAAVHGGFKSEQETMRNFLRHQAAFYSIDEFGLTLRKLDHASKRGGASYLEGIIGFIMSVYSKANGFLPITGDLKEELTEKLRNELARIMKRHDDLDQDSSKDEDRRRLKEMAENTTRTLATIDDGLDSPYLTILGYTTPVTFNDLMSFEQATNGFMARAMIFNDLETNPKRKNKFKKERMSENLATNIRNLYAPGVCDTTTKGARIEFNGEKMGVPTTDDGAELLEMVYERFHEMADAQKGATGLEAIPRRGYELAAKVSLVLALPSGVRTSEHILWGYALAMRDVENKIKLAYATDSSEESSGKAARILALLDQEHGETFGVIKNRMRGTPEAEIKAIIEKMIEKGMLRAEDSQHPTNKKTVTRYFAMK